MTSVELLAAIVAMRTRRRPGGYAPLIVLVVSAFVFVGLGVLRWELTFVLSFLAAIFVHETGHVLAMRLFRYRDLRMMFIPFIGGMAGGDPDDLDAGRIAAISLAGPLIGLLGGLTAAGLAHLTGIEDFRHFGWISLYLNLFNLLPLVPLDGGHFINELLFARRPRAELVFKAVALVALAAIIIVSKFYILGVVVVLMLTTIRSDYRMAVAIEALRSNPVLAGGALTGPKVEQLRAMLERVTPALLAEANREKLPAGVWEAWIKVKKLFPPPRWVARLFGTYAFVLLVLAPLTWLALSLGTGVVPVP
ncbi:hypothetical protein MASR2M8_18800 [Opitutaceae bacterium]